MNEHNQDKQIDIADIRKRLSESQGKAYWRSLDELAETEEFQEFLHQEFPRQAAPLQSSLNRRDFMKLLGASLALAGLAACAAPVRESEKIVPYVRAPEEVVPGKPLFYASAITSGGYASGVLVESHMGRPTKIEGNPDHPASLGATDSMMQASVLTLYDPDRSQNVSQEGNMSTWEDATAALSAALAGLEDGEGLHILSGTITSPTLTSQLNQVLGKYPEARWHQYDPSHSDNVLTGAELAFGEAVQTRYELSEAEVILSLGADFLGSGPGKLRYTREYSRRRRVYDEEHAEMNRLYLVESTPSITGSVADHRLPLRDAEIEALARALAEEFGIEAQASGRPEAVSAEWFEALLEDLQEARGKSLVIAGAEQSPAVHVLAHAINEALGNVGQTVIYSEPVAANPVNQLASLTTLVNDMNADKVNTLVMIGGNPVYNAPADLNFAAALNKVPLSVHLSMYQDETSAVSTWHIPQTHELETWSDARAFDGTATIMQPLIAPFYGGKSAHELLAAVLGETETNSYDVIRAFWREQAEGDFDAFWRNTVYRGVVEGTELKTKEVSLTAEIPAPSATANGEALEVVFRPDPSIGSGEYANNGWLQELPKPFTKLTWDNAALVGPATAERLNLRQDDVVELSLDGRSVEAPVFILPGQADNVVTLHLGYGRSNAGNVGTGAGFNAYALRNSENPWSATELSLSKTGERYKLSSTQIHFSMDGRNLVRSGTLAEYEENPEFVEEMEHIVESDLYTDWEYNSYAWGMVIDQTVCTGCNACVTACQAENNIPIVGKDEVAIGREMHWIRVDSYYRGDLDNPELLHQPLPCMQCEKAPCEPVCPVGATMHDTEGLNVMVYNRCVGTRYCSNNCPYKVRRFNYLQYAELEENAFAMQKNPDVTVRSRGVMEKCTYCTQRINTARIQAELEHRSIQDGEVVTACQAACPAEAIVFGDINDPGSKVTAYKASPLNYGLLTELNTFPRTTYLAKLRNPNPALLAAGEEGGRA